MPNSQRGVFTSNGYTGYWRRIQKSFVDYVGSSTIRETPNLSISSTPTSNRRLSLPTARIVSATVSSKIGFIEWHTSRGGWVTYAQDFPTTWLGCGLIIGTSSGVPIKKGAMETIGAATPAGKGKEIRPEKMKAVDVEESTGGMKAGPKEKRTKTGKSQKQLVSQKEKEVGQPLATRTRKKTKVESSFSQVPVTSSVHGPLGSSDFVSQSPLGPSGRTHSKQKTLKESVKRERERQDLFPSSLFYICYYCCSHFLLLANEQLFPLQSKRKSDFKKDKSPSFSDDVVWPFLFHAFPFALVPFFFFFFFGTVCL